MALDYEQRLEKHIEALEKSYDNIILMLKEDIEKTDDGKIKLKDSQRKVYAEGILKASETADSIIKQIKSKQQELDKIRNPEKPQDGTPEPATDGEESSDSDLGTRLK